MQVRKKSAEDQKSFGERNRGYSDNKSNWGKEGYDGFQL